MKTFSITILLLFMTLLIATNSGNFPPWLNFYRKIPYGDKVGHFFIMGFLAFAINCLMKNACFQIKGWRILKGSLLVALFVTIEEPLQVYIPNRTFSYFDLIANYLGIMTSGFLVCAFHINRSREGNQV